MPDVPANRMRAGDDDREEVLTALQRAYEAGRLDLDEMHERQERALRSKYTDELAPIVVDLPEGRELSAASPTTPDVPTRRHTALPATGPEDAGFSMTVMSGKDVKVPSGTRFLTNFAWWGGDTYDLTEAMGPGRVVTLTLHAIMAGSDILVPEGVRVIDQSLAIMAGNEIAPGAQGDGSNGTLIIGGFLWWAGNEVKLADGS